MSRRSSAFLRPLFCIATFIPLSGCATGAMQMKIAPDLATTVPTPVTGRSAGGWTREFQFASWRVRLRESPLVWNASSRFSIPPLPSNTELHVAFDRASVRYELTSASQNLVTAANCLAQGRFAGVTEYRGRVTDSTEITLPGYPRVNCDFTGAHQGTLALRVTNYVSQRDSGDVELNGHKWSIRSINNLQSGSFPVARLGYEILADEKVLASVETWTIGKLWLSPNATPTQQEEIAVIAAALLQYTSLLGAQDE
jgi:hypothetical protein